MAVTWHNHESCGFVVLNNPPVNAINHNMREGLISAVKWAEREKLKRVILSGSGRGFAAGADTKEFDHSPVSPHLPDVINCIEASTVPWIAAIHGAALGGGGELALGCRYRIARADATIGFPEVILGLVPGAGATQRLPRLIGLKEALKLIPTGKTISGRAAMAIGLVDAIDDDPINAAKLIDQKILSELVPLNLTKAGADKTVNYDAARQIAIRRMRGQEAPLTSISLLEMAQTTTFDDGMQKERAAFLALRASSQARALRHIFFTERAAKKPPKAIATQKFNLKPLDHVVVIGGGTMGSGIAYAFLNASIRVTILESDDPGIKRANTAIDKIISASLASGHIDPQAAADRRNRLTVMMIQPDSDTGKLANGNLTNVDLVIEAVYEDLSIKREILQAIEPALNRNAIIATNTSYLDVNKLAACLDNPSRFVGLHFFAPAHIMKLLEIVKGSETSPAALAMGYAVAKSLGKMPVVAGVCDGFIGNRILAALREAADAILMDGSTPSEIDEAIVAFGYAMGPYETQDLSGLDIAHANRRRLDASRDPSRRYIPIADYLVTQNRLGKKTGAGWYHYPNGKIAIDPKVEDIICREAKAANIKRRHFSSDEIQQRLLLAMVNEAANILNEGIAVSAADIDLVLVHGYGFPRWRGGLMHYADQLGATLIMTELTKLCEEDALFWKPSQLIIDCARTGRNFASYNNQSAKQPNG